MEFEEVRKYQFGDDIRTIDWNVSARYGEPFVKVFREERELTVLILADMSASHLFGTAGQLKRDLMAEVCATLAFSAIRNNDKVGLILFTDHVEKVVPARKGSSHVLRVIREMLYHQPAAKGTDLSAALEHLNRATTRRSVTFVVSDFLCGGYERSMRIARRKHDVIPIIVTDPCEQALPDVGLIALDDAETGEVAIIDTSNRRLRRAYEERTRKAVEDRDRLLSRMNIDAIRVWTGESFVEPLTRFFRERKAKR